MTSYSVPPAVPPAPLRIAPGGDPMLAELIAVLDGAGGAAAGLEIAVTLIVPGTLLRGFLMPGGRWFEEVAEALGNVVVTTPAGRLDDPGKEVGSAFAQLPAEFKHYYESAFESGPEFAHLRVAHDNPLFYRIRLEEISGWAFGT